ncbi:uncharacterized protein PAE49_003433 [Odontesthes bonariensis]
MAEDAPEYPASLGESDSYFEPSLFFFQHFNCKAELLSYLLLCVAKMPFIPPVSIARSVSGLTGREETINCTSSANNVAKSKVPREDKGSSVKERLTSNLKQLGRKSHLPTAKGASAAELHGKKRDRLLPSSQTDSFPTSSSGKSLSKKLQHKPSSHSCVKREPALRKRDQEETRFTLTLTPEAVLLLQRRNSERHQHSAARNPANGADGGAADSRRRKESVSKRHQAAAQRNRSSNGRVAAKINADAHLGDISSIVKISLLNEKHKYDDVEYEEEVCGVDERVLLKCTEWLRGLENAPVTAGKNMNRSGVKSF